MSIYVLFCNIFKVNHLFECFMIFLHLISSFSHTRSLLVPFAYVSIELIDCILLSSLALNVMLTSSVNTVCFSLLYLYCDFNIIYCLYKFFMISSKTVHIGFIFFKLVHFILKLGCF